VLTFPVQFVAICISIKTVAACSKQRLIFAMQNLGILGADRCRGKIFASSIIIGYLQNMFPEQIKDDDNDSLIVHTSRITWIV